MPVLHFAMTLAESLPENLLSMEKIGLVGVLAIGIFGFLRGWVVPGSMYTDMKVQNDRLRDENARMRVENDELKDENRAIRQQLVRPAVTAAEELARKVQPPGA